MVKNRYPFLISVPHGGTTVPDSVRPRLLLTDEELLYYCDPLTRVVFGYKDRVEAYIDTPISRMVVDLNRPPLPLPLRDPDGIIKLMTIDGREVYRPGDIPDMHIIHTLLMTHYFPFHQQIDELIDRHPVRIAFDCHSMLPQGSENRRMPERIVLVSVLGIMVTDGAGQEKGALPRAARSGLPRLPVFF